MLPNAMQWCGGIYGNGMLQIEVEKLIINVGVGVGLLGERRQLPPAPRCVICIPHGNIHGEKGVVEGGEVSLVSS